MTDIEINNYLVNVKGFIDDLETATIAVLFYGADKEFIDRYCDNQYKENQGK